MLLPEALQCNPDHRFWHATLNYGRRTQLCYICTPVSQADHAEDVCWSNEEMVYLPP